MRQQKGDYSGRVVFASRASQAREAARVLQIQIFACRLVASPMDPLGCPCERRGLPV